MIEAKNYSSRTELEKDIISKELKGIVNGTKEELARLELSDKTTIHGLKCLITDEPSQPKHQQERPQRGEIHDSKINGNIIKIKK